MLLGSSKKYCKIKQEILNNQTRNIACSLDLVGAYRTTMGSFDLRRNRRANASQRLASVVRNMKDVIGKIHYPICNVLSAMVFYHTGDDKNHLKMLEISLFRNHLESFLELQIVFYTWSGGPLEYGLPVETALEFHFFDIIFAYSGQKWTISLAGKNQDSNTRPSVIFVLPSICRITRPNTKEWG